MKPFLALLGLNFKSLLLTSMNIGNSKKKAASGIGALLLISFLMVYLSGIYSFMLASSLAPAGGLDIMLMMMLGMVVAYPLMFTLFTAQSMVFSTKDMDIVLCFPLSSFKIMLARVFALYLETVLMIELMLAPVSVAYLLYGGRGGAGFVLLMLVLGIFLAFIPTFVCLVFGTLVSLLVARLRLKNLFTVLFSVLLVAAFVVGSTFFSAGSEVMVSDISGFRAMISAALPPLAWAAKALMQPDLLLFIGLLLGCTLPFFATTWLFSLFFKQILTALASHAMKSNYKLKGVGASSAMVALLKKEAGRFFGTPVFVLNYGIMLFLCIVISIVAVFIKDSLYTTFSLVLGAPGAPFGVDSIPPLLLVSMGSVLCSFTPSSVSVSLEGKTLWILKEAPLGTARIFAAKIGFGALLTGATFTLCSLLLGYAFSLNFLHIVLIILLGVLACTLTSSIGLYVNLLFPRMDSENDTVVVKQSASGIISMLGCLLAIGLMVGLYFLLTRIAGLGFLAFSTVALAALLLLNAGMLLLLNTSGKQLFKRL